VLGGEEVYGEGTMANSEEVMTTLRTEGNFKAELRIVVVPWMAGLMTSRSGSPSLKKKHRVSYVFFSTFRDGETYREW
jgi:hypothetical protein